MTINLYVVSSKMTARQRARLLVLDHHRSSKPGGSIFDEHEAQRILAGAEQQYSQTLMYLHMHEFVERVWYSDLMQLFTMADITSKLYAKECAQLPPVGDPSYEGEYARLALYKEHIEEVVGKLLRYQKAFPLLEKAASGAPLFDDTKTSLLTRAYQQIDWLRTWLYNDEDRFALVIPDPDPEVVDAMVEEVVTRAGIYVGATVHGLKSKPQDYYISIVGGKPA